MGEKRRWWAQQVTRLLQVADSTYLYVLCIVKDNYPSDREVPEISALSRVNSKSLKNKHYTLYKN